MGGVVDKPLKIKQLQDGNLAVDEKHSYPTIELVDLGLPSGILWAKTNVGGESETDYGQYFQWASTTPLNVNINTGVVNPAADWNLCPYTTDGVTFTKYNETDKLTVLQASDDIATITYGPGYRMPTQVDAQELLDYTDRYWVLINGVYGCKFVNRTDSTKYIFMPIVGRCYESSWYNRFDGNDGLVGDYWTSSIYDEYWNNFKYAFRIRVEEYDDNDSVQVDGEFRHYGCAIRPIYVSQS